MVAEERVVIKVEINSDVAKDSAAVVSEVKAMEKTLESMSNRTSGRFDKLDKSSKKFKKAIEGAGEALFKFLQTLAKFSVIGIAGQLALFSATLVGIKAVIAGSRLAVRGYQIALQGLSFAAASVASGLAVAAAAMREFKEAQLAPYFGGGLAGKAAAASVSRALSSRMTGLLGGEAAMGVTAALAKGGIRGPQVNPLVTQLYNLTGGDAKAVQSIAAALGGKDVAKALEEVQGAAGFREGSLSGVSSMSALISAISSGSTVSKAFADLGDVMGSTLFGSFKIEFERIKTLFADIGAPMLTPVRESLMKVSRIIHEDVLSLNGIIQRFGSEKLTSVIVKVVDKVSEFVRSNIVGNLTDVDSISKSFSTMLDKVQGFYYRVKDWFIALEPASNVMIDMFKAIKDAAVGTGSFQSFSTLVSDNSDALKEFGTSVGNVLKAVAEFLATGQSGFFAKLPAFSEILNKLADRAIPALGDLFSKFVPLLERLPAAIEGFAQIIEVLTPIAEKFVSAVTYMTDNLANPIQQLIALLGGTIAVKKGPEVAASVATRAVFGGKAAKGGGFFSRIVGGVKGIFGKGSAAAAEAGAAEAGVAEAAAAASKGGKLAGILSKVGKGSKFAKFGNILSIIGLATDSMSAYSTGKQTGMGALSSALSGLTLGASVGGVPGALIGTVLGTGLYTASGILGERKNRAAVNESFKTAGESMANLDLGKFKTAADIKKLREAQKVTSTDALFIRAALIASKQGKYTEAQIEEYASPYKNSKADYEREKQRFRSELKGMDTPEFRNVLKRLSERGIDTSNAKAVFANLESYLEGLDNQSKNMSTSLKTFDTNMESLTTTLDVSSDKILEFAQTLNVDLKTALDTAALGALYILKNAPQIDRTKAFLPDLSMSMVGKTEKRATVNAKINALAEAARSGQYDTSLISDFLTSFSQMEVAYGGNVDVSALSGYQALRQKAQQGLLGNAQAFMTQYSVPEMEKQIIDKIATAFSISSTKLMGAYMGTGIPGATPDVNRVASYIDTMKTQRERLQRGIFGGNLSELGVDFSSDVGVGFRDYVKKSMGIDLSSAKNMDQIQSMLEAVPVKEGAPSRVVQAISGYLSSADTSDRTQINLLEQIRANTLLAATRPFPGMPGYMTERLPIINGLVNGYVPIPRAGDGAFSMTGA